MDRLPRLSKALGLGDVVPASRHPGRGQVLLLPEGGSHERPSIQAQHRAAGVRRVRGRGGARIEPDLAQPCATLAPTHQSIDHRQADRGTRKAPRPRSWLVRLGSKDRGRRRRQILKAGGSRQVATYDWLSAESGRKTPESRANGGKSLCSPLMAGLGTRPGPFGPPVEEITITSSRWLRAVRTRCRTSCRPVNSAIDSGAHRSGVA
jgi:hypothetical protein